MQFSATLQQQYGKDRRITDQMGKSGKKPVPQCKANKNPSLILILCNSEDNSCPSDG